MAGVKMRDRVDASIHAGLLALGLVTRFACLNYPREVVWDEFHFGKFVNGYLTGEYFFDIHPPFGKMVLAFGGYLGGYNATHGWTKIGEPITADVSLFALRSGPAFQGALLPLLLFAAGRSLGLSRPAALLAPSGALFDLLCLIEQRLVVTDATLLLGFGLQLAAAFASSHFAPLSAGWLRRLVVEAAGIAIAGSTKMTGFGTLATSGVHSILCLWRGYRRGDRKVRLLAEAALRGAILLGIPVMAYLLCCNLHLALLPKTGDGARFHSERFRSGLIGDPFEINTAPSDMVRTPLSLWGRIAELNRQMVKRNADIKKGHGWGSRWWEWPLMSRSILYWTGTEVPYISPPALTRARIYGMGNPAVWWLAALSPAAFMAWAVARFLNPLPPSRGDETVEKDGSDAAGAFPAADPAIADLATDTAEAPAASSRPLGPHGRMATGMLLLVGYLGNWIPFVLVDRVAFLYHFLPSLLHALLLAGLLLDVAVPAKPLLATRDADDPRLLDSIAPGTGLCHDGASHNDARRWLVLGVIVYAFAASFAYFAPLVYGQPLSQEAFDARIWLPGWR